MWPGCPPGEAAHPLVCGGAAVSQWPASLAETSVAALAPVAWEVGAKQSRDWTGCAPRWLLQLLTSRGSLCSSTLRIGEEGSWEWAGGVWERGPALRAQRSRPAGLRGRRGCGNGSSPIPDGGKESKKVFWPAIRLLDVGLVFSVLSEGWWGEESRAALGSGLCCYFPTMGPVWPYHPSAPCALCLLVPRARGAQPRGAVRGGSGRAASRPGASEGGRLAS